VDDDSVVNKGMVSDSTVLDELTEWVITFLQETLSVLGSYKPKYYDYKGPWQV